MLITLIKHTLNFLSKGGLIRAIIISSLEFHESLQWLSFLPLPVIHDFPGKGIIILKYQSGIIQMLTTLQCLLIAIRQNKPKKVISSPRKPRPLATLPSTSSLILCLLSQLAVCVLRASFWKQII